VDHRDHGRQAGDARHRRGPGPLTPRRRCSRSCHLASVPLLDHVGFLASARDAGSPGSGATPCVRGFPQGRQTSPGTVPRPFTGYDDEPCRRRAQEQEAGDRLEQREGSDTGGCRQGRGQSWAVHDLVRGGSRPAPSHRSRNPAPDGGRPCPAGADRSRRRSSRGVIVGRGARRP
jgi:hypothetical protein